jgi:threonyl-tRNA synthetase
VGRKIRDAELEKVPFMLVVGDEEERAASVSVRRHGEGDLGLMSLAEIADRILSADSEPRYTRAG